MINKLLISSFLLILLLTLFLLPFSAETIGFIASLKGGYVPEFSETHLFIILFNKFLQTDLIGIFTLKVFFLFLQFFALLGTYKLFQFFFEDKLSFLASDSFFIFIAGFLLFFAVASFQTEIIEFPFLIWDVFFLIKYYEIRRTKYFLAWFFFFLLAGLFGTALTFFALAVINIALNFYYQNEITESPLIVTILTFVFGLIFIVYFFEDYKLFVFPSYKIWHLLLLAPWLPMSFFAYFYSKKKTLSSYETLFKFTLIASFIALLSYFITANASFLLLVSVFTAPALALVFYKFLYFRKNVITAQFLFMTSGFFALIGLYYFYTRSWDYLHIAIFVLGLIFLVIAFILIFIGLTYDLSIIKSTLIGSFAIFLVYIFALHPKLEETNPGVISAYSLSLQKIPLEKIRLYLVTPEYENAYYLFYPELPEEWNLQDSQDLWIFASAEGFLEINSLQNIEIKSLTEFQGKQNGVDYRYYLLHIAEKS